MLHVSAKSRAAKKSEPVPPIVLIASLVNSHDILDLSERSSLARFLSGQGHDIWLVDWGQPDTTKGGLDLADHVEQALVPLLRGLDRPPLLVGYCLGGAIALAAAHLLPVTGLVTIAAPWHFDRFPDADRQLILNLWQQSKPLCERLGYAPMEILQTGFWALDPSRTIRKYAAFADFPDGSEAQHAFLAVEDWANEGAPLSFNAARDLFERFYGDNAPGAGNWTVGDHVIRAENLSFPSLSIASTTDRIVPAAASARLGDHIESALGHVGMIVSHHAPEQIWRPLSQWLERQRP